MVKEELLKIMEKGLKEINKKFDIDFNIKDFSLNEEKTEIVIEGYANVAFNDDGSFNVDRDGDVILPMGIDLTNFKKNPIMLYQHKRDEPCGKYIDLKLTDKGLYVKGIVYKDLHPQAFVGVEKGVITAFSIGFLAKEGYWVNDEVWMYSQVELTEISLVSVPASADSIFSLAKQACGKYCLSKNLSKGESNMQKEELKGLTKEEVLEAVKEAIELSKEEGVTVDKLEDVTITNDNLESIIITYNELGAKINKFLKDNLDK